MSGQSSEHRTLSILLVHERFPPDWGGGGEYVVLQIARHLLEAGHRLSVLSTGSPAQDHFEGVPIQRLPIHRYRLNFAASGIAAAARSAEADLIHCFSYQAAFPSWLAGRRLGTPVVLGVLALFGATWLRMRGPVTGRLLRWFETFVMRLPFARRFFLSDASLALARSLRLGRPGDCVITPGISLPDYHAAQEKDGVIFSGKLEGRKGIEVVQQVARALPHIAFRAIVWGAEFYDVVARSPANMKVERFEDRHQLADALAHARILLFPSKAETFGLVVAEAMASGCAVVGSAPIAFEGARIDPDDVPGVTLALQRLWDDPQRCRAAGARNQVLARAYSWRGHVAALEACYREVISNRVAALSPPEERSIQS